MKKEKRKKSFSQFSFFRLPTSLLKMPRKSPVLLLPSFPFLFCFFFFFFLLLLFFFSSFSSAVFPSSCSLLLPLLVVVLVPFRRLRSSRSSKLGCGRGFCPARAVEVRSSAAVRDSREPFPGLWRPKTNE